MRLAGRKTRSGDWPTHDQAVERRAALRPARAVRSVAATPDADEHASLHDLRRLPLRDLRDVSDRPRLGRAVLRRYLRRLHVSHRIRQALPIAGAQQSRWLALRAGTSLARLRQRQERPADARRLLEPLVDEIAEAASTLPDAAAAHALLRDLHGNRG